MKSIYAMLVVSLHQKGDIYSGLGEDASSCGGGQGYQERKTDAEERDSATDSGECERQKESTEG